MGHTDIHAEERAVFSQSQKDLIFRSNNGTLRLGNRHPLLMAIWAPRDKPISESVLDYSATEWTCFSRVCTTQAGQSMMLSHLTIDTRFVDPNGLIGIRNHYCGNSIT